MSRPTVVHVAAWGDVWRERALTEVLQCLSANLSASSDLSDELRLVISTDDPDEFIEMGVVHRFANVSFRKVDVPPTPSESRDLLGDCELQSLKAAHELGADWVPLCADNVFPVGHLAGVKQQLAAGRKAVVGTGLRCSRSAFCLEESYWHLSAEQFRAAQVGHLHPQVMDYAVGADLQQAPANVHMLVFPSETGFAVRQGQLSLLGLHAAALDAVPDRPVVECQLLADLTDDYDRDLYFAGGDDGIMLAGLDDERVTEFGRFPATAAELVRLQRLFERTPRDRALWAWAFNHRVDYTVPDVVPACGLPAPSREREIRECNAVMEGLQ